MTTTASEETTISEIKVESPISDDVIDPVKEMESKFAKCGISMNDDEISVDIASATGLRKTGFSEVLYEDNPIIAARKAASKIPKSPMLTRRKSMDNCSTIPATNEGTNSLRKIPAYRSVRKSQQQQQTPQKEKIPSKENTWNGRSSVSPTNQNKKRPALTADTFKSPTRTASLTRNTPTRSSQQLDGRTRQRSSTRASSVNTSPNKSNSINNNLQSQLAQQLLDAAGKAKNDAQILGKIKQILNDYASKNKVNGEFDDFTTTWVNNNGSLDTTDAVNMNNNGSPIKSQSKRSSSVSTSSDSNPTISAREMPTMVVSPRRVDKGLSRIPAPIRSNTGLY